MLSKLVFALVLGTNLIYLYKSEHHFVFIRMFICLYWKTRQSKKIFLEVKTQALFPHALLNDAII